MSKVMIVEGEKELKALEDLMTFDSSQSSKWPKITIHVQSGGSDSYEDPELTVWVNERPITFPRNMDVQVPPEAVDALYHAIGATMQRYNPPGWREGDPVIYKSKPVSRFPFRIVGEKPQRNYDAWKNAQEIVRTVITETSYVDHPNGKRIYTVEKRYLPPEKVSKAAEMVEWVKNALAEQEDKADKKAAAA